MNISPKDKCWTVIVSFVFSENKYHEMLHNKLIKLPVINPDAFLSWMFWLHWLPDVFVKDDHSNRADDQGYYRLKKYIKDWTLNLIFVFCRPSLIIKVTNSFPARALRALGLLLADGTPTVGGGKTFWAVSRIFFTETAVTPDRKVEKLFPRWEINRHVEG